MSTELMGCCGAYCKPCKVYTQNLCKGCKIGYVTGERDIARAKCPMKVCCIRRGLISCADCAEYASCEILAVYFGHDGYKYRKYHEALEYIRAHGYDAFFHEADSWSGAYGKLGKRGDEGKKHLK